VTRRLQIASAVAVAVAGGAAPVAAAPAPQTLCTLPARAAKLPAATLRGLIGHLEQYPDVSLAAPAERRAAQAVLDTLRSRVGRWTTLRAARRAGFQTPTGRRRADDRGPHYLHAERLRERRDDRVFDPRRPKALIFAREPGRPAVLVGAMYSVQRGERGPTPGGPITRWHSHLVCVVGKKRGLDPRADGTCAPRSVARQGSEMMHVWFTRDLRSAFAIGAPEPELCRLGLLSSGFCRDPGSRRGM
jgi:hypothetical protein